MLFVGGLEELLSLWYLTVVVCFAIFECRIGDVSLLVERIGSVIGRAVEFVHAIKLWIRVGDHQTGLIDNKINVL